MSGDAKEGTGAFSAQNSSITTNAGDTFFITNTTADISLTGNIIKNNDASSAFLRAQSGKWGNSGANGGIVKLSLSSQVVEGDIILDNLSSLSMLLSQSYYMGVINGANTANSISVTLDSSSQLVLAGDSYISELSNEDSSNQNIYSNGYKLFINGSEVAINGGETIPEAPQVILDTEEDTPLATTEPTTDCVGGPDNTDCAIVTSTNTNAIIFVIIAVVAIIIAAVITLLVRKGKKSSASSLPTIPTEPTLISQQPPIHPESSTSSTPSSESITPSEFTTPTTTPPQA